MRILSSVLMAAALLVTVDAPDPEYVDTGPLDMLAYENTATTVVKVGAPLELLEVGSPSTRLTSHLMYGDRPPG